MASIGVEVQQDRPCQLNLLVYSGIRLQEWKVSETQEMVEQMIEMGQNRINDIGNLQNLLHRTGTVLRRLGGLQEELGRVQSPQPLTPEQSLELGNFIQDSSLERVWQQEKREREKWWNQERQRQSQREQKLQRLLPELPEPIELDDPQFRAFEAFDPLWRLQKAGLLPLPTPTLSAQSLAILLASVGTLLLAWVWEWVLWMWAQVRVIMRGDKVGVVRWLQGTRERMRLRIQAAQA